MKLTNDNRFQDLFNPSNSDKSLKKKIESSYLNGKTITTILDNIPTSSTSIEIKISANKISSISLDQKELTKVKDVPLKFKRKIKHKAMMFFNINGYKNNFKAKVIALIDAYRTAHKEQVIKELTDNTSDLRKYPQYNNDRDVVLVAVQNNGANLLYASYELRNDREIVLAAIKKYRHAYYDASYELQNDPEIRKAAGQI